MNRPVYKRYRYLDQNENAWYEDSAYVTDLEKYCDELEKAFEIATEILDEQSGEGTLLCPQEWLGYCHCETTDSGYECEGDIDYANWHYCILEKIKNIKG